MTINDTTELQPELTVRHVRGRDFREHRADAFMYRLEGDQAVLTFYKTDVVINSETLELRSDPASGHNYYATVSVDQEQFREDAVSVRLPLHGLLLAAQAMLNDVTPDAASEEGGSDGQ